MLSLVAHEFSGSSAQFVIVVAGIHASEQSGVEVARWIGAKLDGREKPTRFGAIIVPELFPRRGEQARTAEWKTGSAAAFREIVQGRKTIYPNRQFPPPGRSLEFLRDGYLKDLQGRDIKIGRERVPLLAEARYLIRLIEAVKPIRIVSIHGMRPRTKNDLKNAAAHKIIDMTDAQISKWDGTAVKGVNFPGIFVDPRYRLDPKHRGFDVEDSKFDLALDPAFPKIGGKKRCDSARSDDGREDDMLAIGAAGAVSDISLVPGNHVKESVPVVHYAKEGATPNAFSLGDWAPVDVSPGKGMPGSRRGAPVFTVEVKGNQESWAFLDGVQVMSEQGEPLTRRPTPAQRATGHKGAKFERPPKFDAKRSRDLQAYAQAIIDTILDLP